MNVLFVILLAILAATMVAGDDDEHILATRIGWNYYVEDGSGDNKDPNTYWS